MLKRYQVLLPDWLGDYVEHLVDILDLSFSEIIRAEICYSVLAGVAFTNPDYKLGITPGEISKTAGNYVEGKLSREELHKTISKFYFETRKAVEFRLAAGTKLKKIKKKK